VSGFPEAQEVRRLRNQGSVRGYRHATSNHNSSRRPVRWSNMLKVTKLRCPCGSGNLFEPANYSPDLGYVPVKCCACNFTGRRVNLVVVRDQICGESWEGVESLHWIRLETRASCSSGSSLPAWLTISRKAAGALLAMKSWDTYGNFDDKWEDYWRSGDLDRLLVQFVGNADIYIHRSSLSIFRSSPGVFTTTPSRSAPTKSLVL